MERKPTEPALKLLNRSHSVADARPLIEAASTLLQETINYATNVYMRCMHAGDSSSKDLPVFTLYLHAIEMTDGIEVLISQGCCEPAVPILRSSFEAYMSLRYLLETDYENRSSAWLYFDYRSKCRRYELLDPESDRGKQLRNAVAVERDGFSVPELDEELLSYIRHFPKREGYERMHQEFKRTKNELGRKPSWWFTLFDGPRDLLELARYLDSESFYLIVNSPWTEIAHARDSSRYTVTLPDGTNVGRRLRFPADLCRYAALAGKFLLDSTDIMLVKFRPYESYHRKWTYRMWDEFKKLYDTDVEVISEVIV